MPRKVLSKPAEVKGPQPVVNPNMAIGPVRPVNTTATLPNSVLGAEEAVNPEPVRETVKGLRIRLTEEIFVGAKGKVLEVVEQDDNSLFYLDENGSKWAVSRGGKGRFWEESK